jgi:hypothetical protein
MGCEIEPPRVYAYIGGVVAFKIIYKFVKGLFIQNTIFEPYNTKFVSVDRIW